MTAPACTASDTLGAAVADLFVGTSRAGPPTIGVELELIPHRLADHGIVQLADLRAALRGVPHVSFEPGGQVELNPPPEPTVAAACARLAQLAYQVQTRLAKIGVAATAVGVNPWHEPGLQLGSRRYLAMDAHFASIGPAGRVFMRRTAATQICVGLRTGEAGMAQWRAANLVAPVLAAMFANSPRPGQRTAVCRAAEPGRTRHGEPPMTIEDYVEFAHRATPLDESFAGDDAVHAHLSTLFPPVRPRGQYLEFRALDALPLPRLRQAANLLGCLLADPVSTAEVETLCAPVDPTELWDQAAGADARSPAARSLATQLQDVAHAAASRLPAGYLARS